MKHIKDARKYILEKEYAQALEILDHILSLAPHNPEALCLKAHIYDSYGRFHESLTLLKKAVRHDLTAAHEDLRKRLDEDVEDRTLYVTHSKAGTVYSPCYTQQARLASLGLLGCLMVYLFLFAPIHMEALWSQTVLIFLFFTTVLLPCSFLVWMRFSQIRSIILNDKGIQIFQGSKCSLTPWSQVVCAKVLANPKMPSKQLHLILYGDAASSNTNAPTNTEFLGSWPKPLAPLLTLNLSLNESVIPARRYFLQQVLDHCSLVYYATAEQIKNENQSMKETPFIKPLQTEAIELHTTPAQEELEKEKAA